MKLCYLPVGPDKAICHPVLLQRVSLKLRRMKNGLLFSLAVSTINHKSLRHINKLYFCSRIGLHIFYMSFFIGSSEGLIRENSQNKRSSGADLNHWSSGHWSILSTENFRCVFVLLMWKSEWRHIIYFHTKFPLCICAFNVKIRVKTHYLLSYKIFVVYLCF
jgi:hypothetical protein